MFKNTKAFSTVPLNTPEVKKHHIRYSEVERIGAVSGDEVFVVAYQGKSYAVSVAEILSKITRASLGIDRVNNTPDLEKPISVPTQEALDSKAELMHAHGIGDITGLAVALADKAAQQHLHSISEVQGLAEALNTKVGPIHQHQMSDISGLINALNTKSNLGHAHSMAEVLGLTSALEAKANAVHTHSISEVNGLQFILDTIPTTEYVDGRINSLVESKNYATVAWTTDRLDTKASAIHSHDIAEVRGLVDELSLYVKTTTMDAALNGKSDTNHTHNAAEIQGLTDFILDVAGSGSGGGDGISREEFDLALASKVNNADLGPTVTLVVEDEIAARGLVDKNVTDALEDSKANRLHAHEIADVNELQEALDNRPTFDIIGNTIGNALILDENEW